MLNNVKLFNEALKVRSKAYAPYSKFYVGAAILDNCGKIHVGCNVENVSYPVGTCAEAGAIAAMIASGGTRIKEIVVVADSKTLITPCGACLQRICEFADKDTLIHLADMNGIRRTYGISEMLPLAFDEKELRHD